MDPNEGDRPDQDREPGEREGDRQWADQERTNLRLPWHTDRPGDALTYLLEVPVEGRPFGAHLAELGQQVTAGRITVDRVVQRAEELKRAMNDQAAQEYGNALADRRRREEDERTPLDTDQMNRDQVKRLGDAVGQLIDQAVEQVPGLRMTPGDVFLRMLVLPVEGEAVIDHLAGLFQRGNKGEKQEGETEHKLRELVEGITATLAAGDQAERATRPSGTAYEQRPKSPHLVRGPADKEATTAPNPHAGNPNPRGGPGYSKEDVDPNMVKRQEAVRSNINGGTKGVSDPLVDEMKELTRKVEAGEMSWQDAGPRLAEVSNRMAAEARAKYPDRDQAQPDQADAQ